MRIADWPDSEKPRDKLLEKGPASLSDAELLAIFIRTGTRGRTAVDLARDLLRNYDSLRQLLESDAVEIYNFPGMGQAKYVQLIAALELGKRYLESNLKRGKVLSSPAITIDFLKFRLRAFTHEVFACIFLDNRHRVISYEELFTGTINSANIHPRVVIRRGLFHNSAAVIFAHNHPSGVAEPSPADIAITRRLRDALDLVDIRVLDHFVVGDKQVVSFTQRGLL